MTLEQELENALAAAGRAPGPDERGGGGDGDRAAAGARVYVVAFAGGEEIWDTSPSTARERPSRTGGS